MNPAVAILNRSLRAGLIFGAIAAVVHGGASPACAQPKLEFRALASADDAKDKPAIDAWKAAFADEKNKEKLDQVAAEGKPPAVVEPKEGADKKTDPGRYEFIPVTSGELALIGINLASRFEKDAELRNLLEAARKKREPVVIPVRNLVLYSWANPSGEVSYALLARPDNDDEAISGSEVTDVRVLMDVDDKPVVIVKLTAQGKDKLKSFSEHHRGHYLAIYVRDRLVFAARLSGPITTDELQISGNLESDRAREIRKAIRSCIVPAKTAK